jgi:hypothetical protein
LRLVAIGFIAAGAVAVSVVLIVMSIRRWRRNATAATIEHVFPQLGQRIRTTVQYGELNNDQIEASGVAGTLVEALESDTVRLAQPLPLDAVISEIAGDGLAGGGRRPGRSLRRQLGMEGRPHAGRGRRSPTRSSPSHRAMRP